MKKSSRILRLAMALLAMAALAAPVHADQERGRGRGHDPIPAAEPTLAVKWNQTLLEAVRLQRLGPPMTARAIGMVHTAGFDAWACYDEVAVPTLARPGFRRPFAERDAAHREKAYSYAMYRTLLDLFPAARDVARARMASLGYDPDDLGTDVATAQGVGNLCARTLTEFRHGDGANQLGDLHTGAYSDYTGYTPVNTLDEIVDPNHWQPLRFSNGAGGFVAPGFIAPHWGHVKPFALATGDALRPAGPARWPSRDYDRQAEDVLAINAQLDDRGKAIAEYWADGPRTELPPGHWTLFAEVVSARDRHTFADDVKMFFALGNAVMDAGIAVWDAKAHFDSPRPITSVRFLYAGRMVEAYVPFVGRTLVRGEQWTPYQPATFVTPPFAEYPSGHSAFSSASAEILKRVTGSDRFGHSVTIAAGSSKVEPGVAPSRPVTLRWNTFSEAADEAGYSRLLGGIHFTDGDLHSRALGRQVADLVWARAQEHIRGVSGPVADDDDRDDDRAVVAEAAGALRVTVGPNPTPGRLAVSFAVARPSDVRATVLDLQGREVAVLADAPFAAGTHSLAWDGSRQAPGVYFVNVRRGGATTTSRILIAR